MTSAEQRKSNGENKVKLADIAKQTGYSLATVSKALNGKADISEAARQAIDKALKDNGYIRRVSLSVNNAPSRWYFGILRPFGRWRCSGHHHGGQAAQHQCHGCGKWRPAAPRLFLG